MSDMQATGGEATAFFHINLNCSNFETSLSFYRLIGFEIVTDFEETDQKTFGEIGLGPVLGLPDDCDGRAALLMLKGATHGPRLDLIEWRSPRHPRPVRPDIATPGFGRLCLRTHDADTLHRRLSEAGAICYTPPLETALGGSRIKVFCVEDPDGTVIEFMQFLRPA